MQKVCVQEKDWKEVPKLRAVIIPGESDRRYNIFIFYSFELFAVFSLA